MAVQLEELIEKMLKEDKRFALLYEDQLEWDPIEDPYEVIEDVLIKEGLCGAVHWRRASGQIEIGILLD